MYINLSSIIWLFSCLFNSSCFCQIKKKKYSLVTAVRGTLRVTPKFLGATYKPGAAAWALHLCKIKQSAYLETFLAVDDLLLQVAILHQLDYVWIKQFPWWLYRCFLTNPWTSFTGPQPLFRTQAQGNTDHLSYTKIINIPMIYSLPHVYYFCFSSVIHTSQITNWKQQFKGFKLAVFPALQSNAKNSEFNSFGPFPKLLLRLAVSLGHKSFSSFISICLLLINNSGVCKSSKSKL